MDRQVAGYGFVYQGVRDRTSSKQDGLEAAEVHPLLQQTLELGGDEREVGDPKRRDRAAEARTGLGYDDSSPRHQTPEQDGEPSDMVERQRQQPAVAAGEFYVRP